MDRLEGHAAAYVAQDDGLGPESRALLAGMQTAALASAESRVRVLVVDDSAVVRAVVRRFFAAEAPDTDVLEAENGLEALQAIDIVRFDLVLVDLFMPKLDGVTFIRQVRSDPRFARLAIVVLSTDAAGARGAAALRAGASALVGKPVRRAQLREALLAALRPLSRP